jgi:hypothetical protein
MKVRSESGPVAWPIRQQRAALLIQRNSVGIPTFPRQQLLRRKSAQTSRIDA